MSTSAQVDRSVLEKMEKAQLLQISQELELRVNARMNKKDIIDSIVGVPSESTALDTKAVSPVAPVFNAPTPSVEGASTDQSNGSHAPIPAERPGPVSVDRVRPVVSRSTRVTVPAPEAEVVPTTIRSTSPVGGSESVGLLPPITVVPKSQTQSERGDADSGDVDTLEPRRGESAEQLSRRARRRRGRDRSDRSEGFSEERPSQGGQSQVELNDVYGILDLRDEGFGFVRQGGYLPSNRDVYVAASVVRRYALRKGDFVRGAARPANSNEKYAAVVRIDEISGLDVEVSKSRVRFEDLTPLFPDEKFNLESNDPTSLTPRIVDLISPIGKGQRGLIVSPPKAGKTTIIKQIAHAIEANHPEVHLIMLLVDERPEEVTDIRRSVQGEVVASTFDRPADEHTAISELAIEHAKRMVEQGKDVVIILDGITRLARAYNLAQPATGRIMSGGVDSGALYPPKKFFGAARNVEEGGSLTILATALVETGSKMDEVIFEEFKGTGNMELKLDRRLAERRLYPAIDVNGSSTRHEELLFSRDHLNQIWKLRRVLNALQQEGGSSAPGLELLIDKIRTTRSNAEFLAEIQRSPIG